ncbi:MAG: Rnase Y domain-containing protein [Patescibacteria group bacterium]
MPNNIYQIIILLLIILLAIVAYYAFKLSVKTKDKASFNQEDLDKLVKYKTEKIKEDKQQQLEELKSELKNSYKEKESSMQSDLEAKNNILLEKLRLEAKVQIQEEEKQMRQRILDLQENLDKKESVLDSKLTKYEGDKEKLNELKDELRKIKVDLLEKKRLVDEREENISEQYASKLAAIAKLSSQEAKAQILDTAKEKMGQELLQWQQKYVDRFQDEANIKAREIVALAVQRCSSEVANELTITTVKLEDEADKGKIIGKAGRNIQWLEKTLGVELVIDETPGIVTLSGFSSIRRHIAKKTLEMLLKDGRIHPASIEDYYEKAKSEIAQEIADAGQWAVNELGVYDFPAKLVRIIGRLKFRTSYGQNMLKHSVEMAKLAGLLAEGMNERFSNRENPVNVEICTKGALLHDIGKAVDEETTPKGNHIQLGEKICEMFDLDWRIKKCVSSHHDESYYDPERGFCIEAALVDACDNISGGRLGARKEAAEAYFQRMEAMEKIAENTKGVSKAWIMRGSRELWVFFDTANVSPAKMHSITRKIANAIQAGVRYPGEIKVVGLWENKVVEYAM